MYTLNFLHKSQAQHSYACLGMFKGMTNMDKALALPYKLASRRILNYVNNINTQNFFT